MSLNSFFLIKLLKFLVTSFGVVANIVSISGMATNHLKLFSNHLLLINKTFECKGQQV